MDSNFIGITLIVIGLIVAAAGIVFLIGGKISWFGSLPGDIYIRKKNFTLFFPITTCVVISIVLSIVFMLIRRK